MDFIDLSLLTHQTLQRISKSYLPFHVYLKFLWFASKVIDSWVPAYLSSICFKQVITWKLKKKRSNAGIIDFKKKVSFSIHYLLYRKIITLLREPWGCYVAKKLNLSFMCSIGSETATRRKYLSKRKCFQGKSYLLRQKTCVLKPYQQRTEPNSTLHVSLNVCHKLIFINCTQTQFYFMLQKAIVLEQLWQMLLCIWMQMNLHSCKNSCRHSQKELWLHTQSIQTYAPNTHTCPYFFFLVCCCTPISPIPPTVSLGGFFQSRCWLIFAPVGASVLFFAVSV